MALAEVFTGAGIAVAPPDLPVRTDGLFQAANLIDLPGHGELGLFYDSEGTEGALQLALDETTCLATAATVPDGFSQTHGTPAVLYAAVECFGFGNDWSEFGQAAQRRLKAGQERAIESFLWNTVLPAKATAVSADALSARRALGLLEETAGTSYVYLPTLHFGKNLGIDILDTRVVHTSDPSAYGAKAVNGAGYYGKNGPGDPAVAAGDGEEWLYITGQVSIWRGDVGVYQAFQQTTNKLYAIAMQSVVVAIDSDFASAARVTLE